MNQFWHILDFNWGNPPSDGDLVVDTDGAADSDAEASTSRPSDAGAAEGLLADHVPDPYAVDAGDTKLLEDSQLDSQLLEESQLVAESQCQPEDFMDEDTLELPGIPESKDGDGETIAPVPVAEMLPDPTPAETLPAAPSAASASSDPDPSIEEKIRELRPGCHTKQQLMFNSPMLLNKIWGWVLT